MANVEKEGVRVSEADGRIWVGAEEETFGPELR